MSNPVKKKSAKRPAKKPPTKRAARKPPIVASDMQAFLSQGRAGDIAYVLRAARKDMTSQNAFAWPTVGPASAPDWIANKECGNGLHGWLWGKGDIASCSYALDEGSRWLVCAVFSADVVDLGQKVKFPRAWVVFCGNAKAAADRIATLGAKDGVIFGTATAGYAGTATAGDAGTATAGYAGTATAGERGTATAGDDGTATAGYAGTATAGARGTATAGDAGTATAGYAGTATAGYAGTATAGYAGTATAGARGTATAGDDGLISILYHNGKRWKYKRGSIGENGLLPNVKYRLNAQGEFESVPEEKKSDV